MDAKLGRQSADRAVGQPERESEALRLARSVRRAKARTLRHNRRALRLPAGWALTERKG
jgi:hypothetical protein